MKRAGFTLLELLIVIAIIACVMAIVLPLLVIAMDRDYTFDHVAFANPDYYEQGGLGYLTVVVFETTEGKTLSLPVNLIEVKVQNGQNGDTLSTVFDGNFDGNNNGWQSVTIWVSSEEEKKEWDDFLNQVRQREKEYQDPRTPRRVAPPKI